MYYVISWRFDPEHRDAIHARFKETGGPPPAGVRMLGRWHQIGGGRGACVARSDDPVAVAKWAQEWSDLMTFEVYPALDDEQFGKTM